MKRVFFILFCLATLSAFAQERRTESHLGSVAEIARSIHRERGFPLEYARRGSLPVDEWRTRGRAEVQHQLSYWPKEVPLDVKVHAVSKRDGYEVRTISFAGSPHYRVPAYLLVPTTGRGPFPGVVALHDHGGWLFHGKEKLVRMDGEHTAIQQFRDGAYSGRAYAEDLARRGFVVVVPDAFYWGERRMQWRQPPQELTDRLAGLKPEEYEYVRVTNRYLLETVPTMHMWFGFAGTKWGGIVNYDDRRCVDLLQSLPEVNAQRIGCLGLSGGGFRSTYLAGMDPRIKAAVITGWMTSLPTTLDIHRQVHTYMFSPFGVQAYLDHPDVASLAAPDCALFVQNCAQDGLFTRAGMDAAVEKIRAVYADLKQPERFRGQFYDVPHEFNAGMQEDAFRWLERWLK
jgi:dienelactone hydrolase